MNEPKPLLIASVIVNVILLMHLYFIYSDHRILATFRSQESAQKETSPEPSDCTKDTFECSHELVEFPLMDPNDEFHVLAATDDSLENIPLCDKNVVSEKIDLYGVDIIDRIASLAKDARLKSPLLCGDLMRSVGTDGILYKVKLYQDRSTGHSFAVQLPEHVSFNILINENQIWYTGDGQDGILLGSFQ